MPARNRVRRDPEPLLRDAPLERRRKHPVVPPGDHPDRNLGHAREGPRLTERRARLVGFKPKRPRRSLRQVVVVDDAVVVEVGRGEAELLGVLPLRRSLAGIRPPFAERLARLRDHRVQEDEHVDAGPFAHERCREAPYDWATSTTAVRPPIALTTVSAYSGRPAASSPAAGLPEQHRAPASGVPGRADAIPGQPTGARDKNERRHLPSRRTVSPVRRVTSRRAARPGTPP